MSEILVKVAVFCCLVLVTSCQVLTKNQTADLGTMSAVLPPKSEGIQLERAYNALVKDQLKAGNFYFSLSNDRVAPIKPKNLCYETGCPSNQTLMRDLSVKNESNGCGSYNIHIDFSVFQMDGFNACCDRHDVCYQNCNLNKDNCDNTFESCLLSFCDRWAAKEFWGEIRRMICASMARIMKCSVELFGCIAYRSSKDQACKCMG